jgi:hypothetical protein
MVEKKQEKKEKTGRSRDIQSMPPDLTSHPETLSL